ncbi:MAG: hypothetical protein IPK74_04280 [Deltaproteobacteria bacterium]|nr:hypothetical protein [Deltaproteobacteria bacterium]
MHTLLVAAGAVAASAAHVFTGPDHLAAVAPLAVAKPGRAWAVGAWWGVGHGLGVVALGLLTQILFDGAQAASLSGWCEVAVGVLLVVLGVRALRWRASAPIEHGHRHEHGALGFGLLHGAAGGSHLLVALPALALAPTHAVIYLVAYLIGAVVTMGVFATACGRVVPIARLPDALRVAGVVAVGVGIFWVGTALFAA